MNQYLIFFQTRYTPAKTSLLGMSGDFLQHQQDFYYWNNTLSTAHEMEHKNKEPAKQ